MLVSLSLREPVEHALVVRAQRLLRPLSDNRRGGPLEDLLEQVIVIEPSALGPPSTHSWAPDEPRHRPIVRRTHAEPASSVSGVCASRTCIDRRLRMGSPAPCSELNPTVLARLLPSH